jgi:hypothetical protein
MSWTYEKATGDIVVNGFENGVATSPHTGIANILGANISTEDREAMASYSRVRQSQVNTTATMTITPNDASHLNISAAVTAGLWITVSGSTITNLANGTYYVNRSENGNIVVQLATSYTGTVISTFGLTGSASFTLVRNMGPLVAKAVEPYGASSFRYYVLDSNGLVWVYDTAIADSTTGRLWLLPNYTPLMTGANGVTVLNGWLIIAANDTVATIQRLWCKQTVLLNEDFSSFAGGVLNSQTASANPHFMLNGNQSTMYYTDGNFVGSLFPTSGVPNIFSYASYTASTTTATISSLIGGNIPSVLTVTTRIPAVFFTGGTMPTALTEGTLYYIQYAAGTGTFEVYAAATGGAALDVQTNAVGTQYYNTFYPISAGGAPTYIWTPQALTLPFNEKAQAMAEIGNVLVVGCKSNVIYQWDQVSPQASGFVQLPENNVVNLITVNNMAYAFAGFKGNIYVTNGSTSSKALKVPDYVSGLVEPYYVWGDAAYIRGRVFFSVQDQISGHTGQAGGVWSFIPTENYVVGGVNAGSALRMDNFNSYQDITALNGRATVILPSMDQSARGVQYWAGWISNAVTSPTYGIDFSQTYPEQVAYIETDAIPTGTFLDKATFAQIEYKLATALTSSDAVTFFYRTDLTAAYVSVGTLITETSSVSGYVTVNFEKGQWLQLRVTLTPTAGAGLSSFTRLTEVRVR